MGAATASEFEQMFKRKWGEQAAQGVANEVSVGRADGGPGALECQEGAAERSRLRHGVVPVPLGIGKTLGFGIDV